MDPTAGFQPGLQLQLRDCLVQTDPELYALLSCVAVFCLRLSLTPSLLRAVFVCVWGGGGVANKTSYKSSLEWGEPKGVCMEPPALLLPAVITASFGQHIVTVVLPGTPAQPGVSGLAGPPAAPPEQAGLGCELMAWLVFPLTVPWG